ncbi:unnamed protein product [Mytilus coruscus]|uniref:C1q domain-containing protein n=1 Tax=Mytilus coruscus TaxID=42192 RepID=A0A6J8E5K2_MYTCO|nr:unnamed protein product [Mytilus coruscus]
MFLSTLLKVVDEVQRLSFNRFAFGDLESGKKRLKKTEKENHQFLKVERRRGLLVGGGNGYDTRHGYFTVPISGLYIVSATTCSSPSKGIRTEIVRNGIQLAALYGDDYDLASHTIVVSLEQNDEVWVQHFAEGTSTAHAGGDRYYSSFSGVLIAAS